MSKGTAAATGALSGAAAGASFGPWGALAGGLAGGAIGYFGTPDEEEPFKAAPVDLTNPIVAKQLANSQAQTQRTIDRQAAFVNALGNQGGVTNQSQIYNQLQGVANGTGPNPAQAMLNQATGANVANQAALMASQRGAGANAGMIARQAGMQGANIQQQAAGQGATMQAQQALAAMQAAGNIANQQVSQQGNALQNYSNAALTDQGQKIGGFGQYNGQQVQNYGTATGINAGIAQQQATQQANQTGGLMNGAGAALGALAPAFKSAAPAAGAAPLNVGASTPMAGQPYQSSMVVAAEGGMIPGPSSFVGRHLAGKPAYAQGGKVDAMVSPGEKYLSPKDVKAIETGKKSIMGSAETIPGKPKVGGAKDDYANDTVHKKLEAGGIVLPRSVTQDKNPSKAAAKFVEAILGKRGLK